MTEENAVVSNMVEANEVEEAVAPEKLILKNLVILPPRQLQNGPQESEYHLILPPIRAEEPVQSLRAALAETIYYSHFTNFRFELEEAPQASARNGSSPKSDVISPFTGKDAVVTIPVQFTSGGPDLEESPAIVLDEYGELTPLLEHGLKDGSAFRIVLERYDVASVKDHVARLRSLMDGSAPCVRTLLGDEEMESEKSSESDQKPDKKSMASLRTWESIPAKLDDFFYRACGEDPTDYHGSTFDIGKENGLQASNGGGGSSKGKKKKKGKNGSIDEEDDDGLNPTLVIREKIPRLNELEELTKVLCTIRYSGFHPPPANRRWMGDLAYLEVTLPSNEDRSTSTIHITATATGFYVNQNSVVNGNIVFNPAPAAKPCFSHTLLDCLLAASPVFLNAWSGALSASVERASIMSQLNRGPTLSLFRVATRGDFPGFSSAAAAATSVAQGLDGTMTFPFWLVPCPRSFQSEPTAWSGNALHGYKNARADDELGRTFGVDIRNGGTRDWNEELQLAREMPTTNLRERIERGRLMHKVLTEFGEASLLGVKAICDGHIAPMNPNESTRSQVYLHNNIFFSRAVDVGPETFKIAKGDRAARKSANRDIQCISTFHRMEKSGLHTLATVLIDFLGTRFVCQSVLPGILIGDKSHKLLLGAVETTVPLKFDQDLHKLLEDKVGEGMMMASRPVFRNPFTPERTEEIKKLKMLSPLPLEPLKTGDEKPEDIDPDSVMMSCVPLEAKGIRGSDQRTYVLDFGRLTPRDANWVPEDQGGTGKWEGTKNTSSGDAIPRDLLDDEWTMSVLRPELVQRFTQVAMNKYMQDKKKKEEEKKEALKAEEPVEESSKAEGEKGANSDIKEGEPDEKAKETEESGSKLAAEDVEYLKQLRLNVNVFIPHVRSFDGVNDEAAVLAKEDAQCARDAASFLWDEVLPKVTKAIKEGHVSHAPVDGKSLTEFLHRNGVNCRYLGRLATLAIKEEDEDAQVTAGLKQGHLTYIRTRRTMPKCWLELLECEMVARAAKHVLNSYLSESGGVGAMQPAQIIASFLSALVSEGEETAAQTETRLGKRDPSRPDEDDFNSLTIIDTGGKGNAVPSPIRCRYDVWQDLELEVGRRFRYKLTLYNTGKKTGRSLFLPLLRRICQRTGVRLVARDYNLGGACLCSGGNAHGGRITGSFPLSALDIYDIVPMMKHAAAYSEGFVPCMLGPSIGLPPLQVSCQDARICLERAHLQTSGRALAKGLELAQEAANLYQKVTDNPAHPGVIESMELMANIFMEAGDPALAAVNGIKALGLTVQSSGFDSANVVNAHMMLFQMFFSTRDLERSVKHLRAAMYLTEVLGGPNHSELFPALLKLGNIYSHPDYKGKYLKSAVRVFEEARMRDSSDRLMEGVVEKSFAKVQAGLGNYKEALESEKKAFRNFSMLLGKEHQLTKDSDRDLQTYTKEAVAKGSQMVEKEKLMVEAAKAEAIAADIAAELAAEEERNSKKAAKKKKGKK